MGQGVHNRATEGIDGRQYGICYSVSCFYYKTRWSGTAGLNSNLYELFG